MSDTAIELTPMIQRLRIEPGDVLVIKAKCAHSGREEIAKAVKDLLPGVRVMVFDPSVELCVVRAAALPKEATL